MQIILLGTAAGGGFPQWNCWCPSCRVARNDPDRARRRSQSSAAVSADGRRWFLLNASPDVHAQLGRLPLDEPAGMRQQPVEAVVLTDGELDHTLGL
ncbi:MAG TPA: MBL fold metallo-hydrolase, partial [Gemmatimonadales bacterium]